MPRTRAKARSHHLRSRKLEARVAELEATLFAIRRGQIDALVIGSQSGDQVFTLQGAEHPYRVLVETMDVGAATLDLEGTVLYANSRFAEMFGLSLEKCIGTIIYDHVSPDQHSSLRGLLTAGTRAAVKGDLTLTINAHHPRQLRLGVSPVKQNGIQAICIGATELTEIVEANQALRDNEAALRMLSARLLKLQDDERRHIARDLHDVTGQKLAVLAITLSQLQKTQEVKSNPQVESEVSTCLQVSNQISTEIRTLSYVLHPPLLDELGLLSAVSWYSQGFEGRTGIRVKVDIPGDLVRLPLDSEVALFRVIQESLANVHRHSGSKTAHVRVRADQTHIMVEIKDRGKGMKPSVLQTFNNAVGSLGVGIQGMRERLRQLSGDLEVASQPGRGTTVTARVPLASANGAGISEPFDQPSMPAQTNLDESFAAPTKSAKRILIADDHEVLRRGVSAMLQGNEGEWEVCGEAVNGRDAVEKVRSLNADLVILDINMPVLNGLAAVRRILRSKSETRILVFTVHESAQTVREIREAGAHGYVAKSKAGQDLINAVRAVLSGENFYPPIAAEAHG